MPRLPVTSVLRQRFAATHRVRDIVEGPRDPNQHPILQKQSSLGRWVTISENRPTCMNWLLCLPRH
jgi:hypothetical protein